MPLAVPLLSLFLFSGFTVAQISAPICNSTWDWTFNSLGQSPCTVAAYMLSTCAEGSFSIGGLKPGQKYFGPSSPDDADLCMCSTVGYSLVSACGGCQQGNWVPWSTFSFNCSSPLAPSEFPNPVPEGTRVPGWALLDVTKGNNWDFNKSYAIGDSHEIGPGKLLGPSDLNNSSNAGAIAGGIVGGIAVISIFAVAVFLYWRRRRPLAVSAGDDVVITHRDQIQGPKSGQETIASSFPGTTTPLMKPYNPDDPATYPEYRGVPNTRYSSAPISSPSRNLYTLASIPNSPAQEYRGLPII